MRGTLHLLIKTSCLLAMVLAAPQASQAQQRPQPGEFWCFALSNSDQELCGRVAWDDGKSIFVRLQPGDRPIEIRHELIVKSAPDQARGQWTTQDPAWLNIHGDFHDVKIKNGQRETVVYVPAPWVTDQERQLATAEEDVAAAKQALKRKERLANLEAEVETRRLQARSAFYNYSLHTSLGFFPATVITYPVFNYGNWGCGYYGYGGWGGYPYYLNYVPPTLITLPAVSPAEAGPDARPSPEAPVKAVEAARRALTAARERLQKARASAVFQEGRLVGIRLEAPAEPAAGGPG